MHQVQLTQTSVEDLERLDKPVAQRILDKINWLAENIDLIDPEQLTGEWKKVYKLRVGDYRVLYTFDNVDKNIVIHLIRHRREVYKLP